MQITNTTGPTGRNNITNRKYDSHGFDMSKPKVYLFTYPPVAHVYNPSPFALKIECLLRLYDIPHEVVYTIFNGSKGTIPYARLGDKVTGEEIADSNDIITRLTKEYAIPTMEKPEAHFVLRMIEEHTAQLGFYYRYSLDYKNYNEALEVPKRFFKSETSLLGNLFSRLVPLMSASYSAKKIKYRGLAQHPDEEKWKFCNQDLQALSDYLGDNDWFLGGKEPTIIDCVLFGHLSQFLYIPIDFPQRKYLRANCSNVVAYVDRFRDKIFPDWEDKCKPQEADWSVRPNPPKKSKQSTLQSPLLWSVLLLGTGVALWFAKKRND